MTALGLVLLVLLAGLSISLALIEAAFYSLRRRRLGHLAAEGARAELVNRYLEDPPSLLMPAHVGTYTSHVGMTAVLTWLLLDPWGRWGLAAAVAIMLAYLLVARIWLPWVVTRKNPARTLLLMVPPFHIYARALSPFVNALRRAAARDDEEAVLAAGAPPAPVHDTDEVRQVDALERFSETQVREVMTPRPDIEAIAAAEPVSALRRLMRESKYSRVPIYGENLDDIIGVVTMRDVLEYEGPPERQVGLLARPIYLVPETKRIAELLKELQAQQVTLAVVIDEYGGTAGVVSVEDIVEEIVGEIKDEYDVETEPITLEADGSWLVSGRVSLERLEQYLDAELSDGSDVETVGGLATAVFGRVPRAGERAQLRGFQIEVLDAERKRVNRLRLRRTENAEA